MSSRDKILAAIAANQPQLSALPDLSFLSSRDENALAKFTETLTAIGGKVIEVKSMDEVKVYVQSSAHPEDRIVSNLTELTDVAEVSETLLVSPHDLHNIELAIINAYIGVAENGAVWIKEDQLNQRVLPFICQNLAVVLPADQIVPTMHEAYEKIGNEKYGFATFIAGPSKTADIEQSLVVGAHGSRTMTVFLLT